ncbi:LemA family protein [Paenibacillus sp. 1P07SE]|uniref:LemA family protein n=1 Tax=Paenibacillus sp. 1P07SE TaxID=3132209 RepID=UPI0039A717D6
MWASIIIGAVIVIGIISIYNTLIAARNNVQEAFAAIDVFLEQRFDALSKAAEAVAAYTEHERETMNSIVSLRNQVQLARTSDDKVHAYAEMEGLAGGLRVQAEAYPQLQASANYVHLQKTINDLEEKLSASRRTFNARVNRYNTLIETFPLNLLAAMMNFRRKELLETAAAKKQDVDLRSILRG